jgi:hypothetical protein
VKLVVDTNVPLTANRFPAEKVGCPPRCAAALGALFDGSATLVLDTGYRLIKEYSNKLKSDRPGVGDQFLKWVLTNHMNPERCERVAITPRERGENGPEDYAEFPEDERLVKFDAPDRKFVAVAASHVESPPILQAMDSKWIGWYAALRDAGIRVRFICYTDAAKLYIQKVGEPLPEVHEDDRA